MPLCTAATTVSTPSSMMGLRYPISLTANNATCPPIRLVRSRPPRVAGRTACPTVSICLITLDPAGGKPPGTVDATDVCLACKSATAKVIAQRPQQANKACPEINTDPTHEVANQPALTAIIGPNHPVIAPPTRVVIIPTWAPNSTLTPTHAATSPSAVGLSSPPFIKIVCEADGYFKTQSHSRL